MGGLANVFVVALIGLVVYGAFSWNAEKRRLESQLDALNIQLAKLESENEELRFGAERMMASATASFSDGDLDSAEKSIRELLRRHPHAVQIPSAQQLMDRVQAAISEKNAAAELIEKEKRAAAERETARAEAEAKRQQAEKNRRLKAALAHMRKKVDSIEQITWYYDKSNTSYTNVNSFHLFIGEIQGTAWLRLRVQYAASDWLFIESYFISADGKKYYPSSTEWKQDNSGGGIWEWSDTVPSRSDVDMVRAVIASKTATIRFSGSQYSKDRIIPKQEKLALQRVLDAYEALGGVIGFLDNW